MNVYDGYSNRRSMAKRKSDTLLEQRDRARRARDAARGERTQECIERIRCEGALSDLASAYLDLMAENERLQEWHRALSALLQDQRKNKRHIAAMKSRINQLQLKLKEAQGSRAALVKRLQDDVLRGNESIGDIHRKLNRLISGESVPIMDAIKKIEIELDPGVPYGRDKLSKTQYLRERGTAMRREITGLKAENKTLSDTIAARWLGEEERAAENLDDVLHAVPGIQDFNTPRERREHAMNWIAARVEKEKRHQETFRIFAERNDELAARLKMSGARDPKDLEGVIDDLNEVINEIPVGRDENESRLTYAIGWIRRHVLHDLNRLTSLQDWNKMYGNLVTAVIGLVPEQVAKHNTLPELIEWLRCTVDRSRDAPPKAVNGDGETVTQEMWTDLCKANNVIWQANMNLTAWVGLRDKAINEYEARLKNLMPAGHEFTTDEVFDWLEQTDVRNHRIHDEDGSEIKQEDWDRLVLRLASIRGVLRDSQKRAWDQWKITGDDLAETIGRT